jgi:enterochelin esterase-like enzyme
MRMLHDEFLPLVHRRVGPLPTVIMGWSMGGYGSLLAASRYPSSFVGVAAASPALWPRFSVSAPGAFDSAADFAANRILPGLRVLSRLPVALACGDSDPFHSQAVSLAARLHPRIPPVYGAGFHNDAYWRSVAPRQLASIRRAATLA